MNKLSKEELQRGLKTQLIGRKLFVFESIDSTNICAKTLAEAGAEEGTVVIADFQSEGRGRLGRPWTSDPGTNLLFSVVLRPSLPKESSGLLTFFAATAVARAIQNAAKLTVECKWPNDLLLNGKKVCGILLENSFVGSGIAYSIVGVGLNVNQENFDDQLKLRATSLAGASGKNIDRNGLFRSVLEEMDTLYDGARQGEFRPVLSEWNDRCRMFGQVVTVTQKDYQISGTALRLNADGGLILQTPAGQTTVYAGDISIVS